MAERGAPRISVAMSIYNNERVVAQAIDSILAQSFGDFELLIVDDGSTDGSPAILDDHARRDPRIRLWHEPNRGLVASLNLMIARARGDLIARMDGDDIALPDRFARQVAFFDAHTDHGVLGTNTHEIDDAGTITECTDFHPFDHEAIVAALKRGSPFCHSSVTMRRDVLARVGGYRAAYRHCEDYDLWLRLSTRTRLANLPDRLLLYRRSPGQISSRHVVAQQTGAAIARLAHEARAAGAPDPTESLEALPPIEALDTLFGRPDAARRVCAEVAPNLVYSREAMRGAGFDMLVAHVASGGARSGLWRTVARLIGFGEIERAVRLLRTLISSRDMRG
ncbi:glycosyltransferase [Flavisphingomonas formosensis]|uniref:glycosyltransferase n=1 Tax=Flavisphingomonas formosensis TaxID=861534 RepID=UPI001E5010BB|nr:glycosyltransferase [Sphingomonas formosensis]